MPKFIHRSDGRIERVCKHGVGHPLTRVWRGEYQNWMGVHGCDGCCSLAEFWLDMPEELDRVIGERQEE